MGNLTAKTSGEIASFMTPAKTNIKSLKVHFSPKQLGTGDPSPENVREIEGWDGVEVNGSGKNIAHIVGYSAQNSDSKNSRNISNSYGTTINTTEFSLPDTKLIITQTQSPNTNVPQGYQNGYIAVLVDNLVWGQKYNISFKIDNIISNPLNVLPTNLKLLIPKGDSYSSSGIQDNRVLFKNVLWQPYPNTNINRRNFEIRICGMSFTLSEFMVTPVDEDDFEYEPYQGNMYSKEWSSDVGTIYGGYVDLISGELVEEYHGFIADGENIKANSGYRSTSTNTAGGGFVYILNKDYPSLPDGKNTNNIYCDKLISKNVGSQKNCLYHASNGQLYFVAYVLDINEDNITTNTEAKDKTNEWLKSNPLQIVYELKTPITHQLTPTQLQSFIGQNNFWSNADYVEIEYDLIETEDIQKCRKKIMLNQPHTESVIGDVANFSTNMKAPLKECKVYFNPIQEGSGNPSPDNVRNIIGWDGVNVGLPDEYQEVEYIESSGTQYIITDIPIQQPVTIYIDVMPLSGSNDQAFFVASYEAGQTVRVGTGFYASRIQNYYQRYYTLGEPNSMKINTKHHAEVYLSQGLQTAVLDGTQLSNTRYTHDSTLLPIDGNKINFFMFAEGRLRTSDRVDALFKSHARIYALKVDNADSTIGNFIPCYRKSDGEIGMYDTVSKTFYTNSGTGTFLKGDDVNIIIGNVSWSDEIGTVYGGYVDLVKGEVVATYKKTIIDGSFNAGIFPWQSDSIDINTGKTVTSALYLKRDTGDNKHNRYAIFYCNKLKNISNYNINEVGCSMYDGNSYSVTLTLPKEDVGDTQETLRTYLSNNPIEVVFELAEPIHYQLTPQQLLTFKGENNIWSDTNGQTEVKFWTH